MSITDKIRDYQPGKATLFWSCAGCAVATMIVGFTWGGWVTGGSAQERADLAAEEAVASLAADICFDRYLASPDARVNLAALTEESSYRRDGILEDNGWVTFADREDPIDGAAEICADRLAEVDLSTLPEAAPEPAPVAEAQAEDEPAAGTTTDEPPVADAAPDDEAAADTGEENEDVADAPAAATSGTDTPQTSVQ